MSDVTTSEPLETRAGFAPEAGVGVSLAVGSFGFSVLILAPFAESGDGRYLIQLTGIARYRIEDELTVTTPYRQCRVSFAPFIDDFDARKGEDDVDRDSLLKALKDFLQANNLKADWQGIENAPNEALVNALAMMSPYGTAEKQALLEAPDLKTRAEVLIAITEIELAKKNTEGEPQLQ